MILPSLSADILHYVSKFWYVIPCIVVVLTRKDDVIEISRMGIYYGVLVGIPSCNKFKDRQSGIQIKRLTICRSKDRVHP
jgi:hypothetical protein